MNVVLLRIGMDTGCYCGIYAPLFKDGTFEYVPIPDYPDNVDKRTYGGYIGRNQKPLVDYFPKSYQSKMRGQSIHFDPEFDTFTYGDPSRPKQSLSRLRRGDLLTFYCGLEGFPPEEFQIPRALYLMGYFEVANAGHASEFRESEIRSLFKANAHVLHPANDRERLVLVKGGKGSRKLTKAFKISSLGRDKKGRSLHLLSKEMEEHFGRFTRINAIQRSSPRWVDHAIVEEAARFVRSLE